MLAVDHKSSIMPSGRASGAGWNVETRYNPGVLVGNWQEERVMVSCCFDKLVIEQLKATHHL